MWRILNYFLRININCLFARGERQGVLHVQTPSCLVALKNVKKKRAAKATAHLFV